MTIVKVEASPEIRKIFYLKQTAGDSSGPDLTLSSADASTICEHCGKSYEDHPSEDATRAILKICGNGRDK
jgi:hypothetical protein